MIDDNYVIDGIRFQDDENPEVLYCGPNSPVDALDKGITYDDIVRATIRFLIDEEGFSPESFLIKRDNSDEKKNMLVKVEFINDGITMAKIKGLIE